MNRFSFLWTGIAVSLLATSTSIIAQNRPELLKPTYTNGQNLPFSEGVRVGDVLYLSGVVGIKPGTMTLVPGGLEAETRQVFDNLGTVLNGAGAAPSDVVKCTVMLNDIRQWSKFNEFYTAFFKQHRPARSAFGVAGLALGAAVELECIAAVPRKSR
jgi:2-iminobutanoate/2-iminopropanoate deaminase